MTSSPEDTFQYVSQVDFLPSDTQVKMFTASEQKWQATTQTYMGRLGSIHNAVFAF